VAKQINLFGRASKSDLASNVRYLTELSYHLRQSIITISAGSNDYINNYLQPQFYTTNKTKISERYLVRENVKSLSNSVTKFCDQGILFFPSRISLANFAFSSCVMTVTSYTNLSL